MLREYESVRKEKDSLSNYLDEIQYTYFEVGRRGMPVIERSLISTM